MRQRQEVQVLLLEAVKLLPDTFDPRLAQAAMPLLIAMNRLLDLRDSQLPLECGELVLSSGPEQALDARDKAIREREHIQYAKEFLNHVAEHGKLLDRRR